MWIALSVAAFAFLAGKKVTDTMDQDEIDWRKYDNLFKKYALKYGNDWQWLKAIAMNESSLGKAESVAWGEMYPDDIVNSKSEDGLSWGLMQVTIKTAKGLDASSTEKKLNNPEYSIDLASRLLGKLRASFSMSDPRWMEWVIKSYNQGQGNTRKEISGATKGYAQAYWERFQRNLERVKNDVF